MSFCVDVLDTDWLPKRLVCSIVIVQAHSVRWPISYIPWYHNAKQKSLLRPCSTHTHTHTWKMSLYLRLYTQLSVEWTMYSQILTAVAWVRCWDCSVCRWSLVVQPPTEFATLSVRPAWHRSTHHATCSGRIYNKTKSIHRAKWHRRVCGHDTIAILWV